MINLERLQKRVLKYIGIKEEYADIKTNVKELKKNIKNLKMAENTKNIIEKIKTYHSEVLDLVEVAHHIRYSSKDHQRSDQEISTLLVHIEEAQERELGKLGERNPEVREVILRLKEIKEGITNYFNQSGNLSYWFHRYTTIAVAIMKNPRTLDIKTVFSINEGYLQYNKIIKVLLRKGEIFANSKKNIVGTHAEVVALEFAKDLKQQGYEIISRMAKVLLLSPTI